MLPLFPEKLAESRLDKEKYFDLDSKLRERLGISAEGGSFLGILVPRSYDIEDGDSEDVTDQSPIFCYLGSGNLASDEMEVIRWSMVDGSLSKIEGVMYDPFAFGKEYHIGFPRRDDTGDESMMRVVVEEKTDRVFAKWGMADYQEEWLFLNVYSWSFKKTNRLLKLLVEGDLEAAREEFWR